MADGDSGPRLLAIQIDGLSREALDLALDRDLLPSVRHLLGAGHALHTWHTALPSQTSACQAGLLFGDDLGIPAFRWFEKERGRLIVSNHPGDAAEIERQAGSRTALLARGSSVGNLLSGAAPLSTLTMSTLDDRTRRSEANALLTSPRFWAHELLLMAGEIRREVIESLRARAERRGPRVGRGGSFPMLRAVSTVLLRDLTARVVAADIRAGIPAIYADFVGYDEVAHHAGPLTRDSLDVLRRLDPILGRLLAAAGRHGYEVVLLSDHGQSPGAPFRQRYHESLESLVGRLANGDVSRGAGTTESWGYLNRILSELAGLEHVMAHLWRLVLRPRIRDGYVEAGPDRVSERPEPSEVVVCASGNLGNVYLTKLEGRAAREAIDSAYPGLIEGLARHPGIDFVLVRDGGRPLVVGSAGRRWLDSGEVEGSDPLEKFERSGFDAVGRLRALDRLPHVGDLVLNGRFDPDTGTAAAFEEFTGSHGGLGGAQTEPFIVAPAAWNLPALVHGPYRIHAALMEHAGRIEESGTGTGESSPRDDAGRPDAHEPVALTTAEAAP